MLPPLFHTASHAHTDIPGDLVAKISCDVPRQINTRRSETHQLYRHIRNTMAITAAKYVNREMLMCVLQQNHKMK
jgi:hypothetical protein